MVPQDLEGWLKLGSWLALAWVLALIGRCAWHLQRVRRRRRRFFSWYLFYEGGIAVFAGTCGAALGAWLGLDDQVLYGFVALVGYLGPNGVEALLRRWIDGLALGERVRPANDDACDAGEAGP